MSYFDQISEELLTFKCMGERTLDDGTLLIGKAPHIAPGAWLHKIFPPLTEEDVLELERQLGCSIPDAYRLFLGFHSNGLKIFVDDLSLDGFRKRLQRSEENVWQPYSLITTNIERPGNASDQQFFIGSYTWDGSLLYIKRDTKTVHRCTKESIEPLNTWADFETFLKTEVQRMMKLFDREGKPLDPDMPTNPKPLYRFLPMFCVGLYIVANNRK